MGAGALTSGALRDCSRFAKALEVMRVFYRKYNPIALMRARHPASSSDLVIAEAS
jgi:hypothetical protein